jgi:exonuclease SbcC
VILVDVLIENYKQYAGEHCVAVPSDATVGIIGANGVGKTTLFEAIEWCLYNPPSIKNEQVRPRGLASHTKVAVKMDRPESGERFVVERTLKKAGVSATIYRVEEDGTESVVVQGTRQVSDYVATRLIGLGHGAFVSTFFTRQKELSFFGHLKDTDRRREVGRLLGLETIRRAQESIGEERNQARAEAQSFRRQHGDQAQGRDFAAELEASARCIASGETELARAGRELEVATERLRETTGRRHHWQALKDEDATLHRVLVQIDGKLHGRQERVGLHTAELQRFAKREAELAHLRPIAADEPALLDKVRSHEARREQYQQQQQLRRELERLAEARRGHVRKLRGHVISITLTEPVEGWTWAEADAAAPLPAVSRLRSAVLALDLAAAESRAESLHRCEEAVDAHQKASDTYALYLKRRQEIDAERQELLQAGDPREALRALDEERQQAQAVLSDANARAAALQAERDQTVELLSNLSRSKFGDKCPTCARPFSAAEESLVIGSLTQRRDEFEHRIAAAHDEAKAAKARQRDLAAARQRAEQRVATLQHLLGRLTESEPHILDAKAALDAAECGLANALHHAGMESPPSVDVVTRATARAALYSALAGKSTDLSSLEDDLRQGEDERTTVAEELAALGDVVYDAALHRTVTDELRRARDAAVTIAEIEQQLSRRLEIEQDLDQCRAEIAGLSEERDGIAHQRQALGFEPAQLARAVEDEEAAHVAERVALDAHHAAQTAHRDALTAHDALQQDHQRIAALAVRADSRRREADQLDLMVHEFTAFDRYVAGRYGPILAETTSELVGQVTEGKFDRVEFDENYGIEIFDGDDEKFPLATFSGGERDAIALCARLALSRMVGGQAVSPPGFLVLDEVFGSLDRDRRARLLELLGTLAGATDHFHQLFVISHVDDVQGSAVFDELWRVEETAEGVSQITNATRDDGAAGESV